MSLSPANAQGIQDIESAILCVSLDDAKPLSDDERAWMYWSGGKSEAKGGHGWNRWFDKHDIIVDEAGESGFNGERESFTETLVRAGVVEYDRSGGANGRIWDEDRASCDQQQEAMLVVRALPGSRKQSAKWSIQSSRPNTVERPVRLCGSVF